MYTKTISFEKIEDDIVFQISINDDKEIATVEVKTQEGFCLNIELDYFQIIDFAHTNQNVYFFKSFDERTRTDKTIIFSIKKDDVYVMIMNAINDMKQLYINKNFANSYIDFKTMFLEISKKILPPK